MRSQDYLFYQDYQDFRMMIPQICLRADNKSDL